MSDKTVFQIAIGDIPEDRVRDMQSVREWCTYQGYEYQLITELPEEYLIDSLSARIASDYMRAKILSENPYHMWMDFDVEILDKEFTIGDSPLLVPYFDWCIYNADRTDVFEHVLETMLERKEISGEGWKVEEGTIYKAFRKVPFDKDWMRLDTDQYIVHHWNTLRG